VLVVAGVLALAVSSRGLGGTVSHAWHSFTTTRSSSNYDPGRLLSADSQNRWVWWKEAAGAFSDRPLGGWGAGSFPVTHLLYRRDTLSVAQPHSVPLQWLAESGLIGALLALFGYGLLLTAGVGAVRRRLPSRERLLMASLLGGAVAYALHACYDWDWDIPAVTLPALLFLGVLVGSEGASRRSDEPAVPRESWMRLPQLGSLTLGLCVFALSAALPSLAASDVSSAILTAAGNSSGALQSAQQQASLASDLDPLSDAGPRAQATIALRRGQLRQAQADLLEAVRREPSDAAAWGDLAYSEQVLGDVPATLQAAERSLALDPRGTATGAFAGSVAASANLLVRPPNDSATATPLAEP
jgi:O-Antigen ligase